MKQTDIIDIARIERERRDRAKIIHFVACAILAEIHVPEYEKGLIPIIGSPRTRNNHEAVVCWVKSTWPETIEQPKQVAHALATHLVAILIDLGP